MHVIHARNVAEALPMGVDYLVREGVREDSRAGPVIVAPGPVTTAYSRPQERVLLSPVRDANPFFHLVEAMWMLAGRRDSALLNHFVRDFGERFAEPDGVIHGAYGHRWRHALGYDQLDHVVKILRNDPTSRQAVIAMWDGTEAHEVTQESMGVGTYFGDGSLIAGYSDLTGSWRDRPCNTHAYLRIRGDQGLSVLDLTVCCRSNDIVWGAYGANAVHFSFLQEYLAARIGVGVGTYYQVSNNYHAYVAELERLGVRAGGQGSLREALRVPPTTYEQGVIRPESLVVDPVEFDGELKFLLKLYECLGEGPPDSSVQVFVENLKNEFLSWTVWPMMLAHRHHKAKRPDEAARWMSYVKATDWRRAGREWIERRTK